jgi:hypothetical protein
MAARSLPGWRAWVAIAAGLVGLYAVLGFFVLPPIARGQIVKRARTSLHREASVVRVKFNPFTFAGVVEGLELKDRDGAPLFKVDRFAADFELSGLFRRAWRFREIAVDGLRLHARILDDGRPSVADLFEPDAARPRERKAGLPRVIVDRFVLRRGRAEFTDESRSPDFIQALEPLDLEVHDLITIPEESGDHVVTIGLGKDSLVRWSGKQTVEPSHLEGRVEITGIALGRLWEYAAPSHPLTVSDGRADVVLAYDARRAADGSFAVAMKDATVKARGVIVRPRGGSEDWLEVPSAEVSGLEAVWPESRAEVAAVRVTDPRVLVRRDAGGKMNWAAAMPPAAAPKKEAAKPWTAAIAAVEVKGGRITLDDLAVSPGVKTVLSGVGVRLEKVSTDPSAPVKVEATAAINGSGQASLSGTVVRDPQSANLDVGITRLDLTPFQPYAVRLPGAKFRRGVAEVAGQLRVSPGKPRVQFDGTGGVNALQIAGAGEGRLFAWDRLRARGVRVTLSPDRVRVTEILVGGGFLKLRIDREGNVNLSKLGRPAGARTSSRSAPPATPAAMPVTIGKVVIKNATLDYTDESLILPFGTKIHSVNGGIRDISTAGAAPARLGLEGRVADAGYFKTDGTLRVAAPFAATDVKVIFRNVNMPDLTPYTAEFAGYSVEKGVLDVDVRYRVQDRHLVGDHRVVAKDLVLGPKVEGAKGPGLPVRLAVALLKDKDGRIDLEVPIEGTVDSPTFNYRAVFWQALKKILTNLVTAPFRAIGRLFGADKEDLELVGFASGRSDLPAPEQDKLAKMATELANRVEISLEVEGRFDPVIDADALRRARLEAKIDAKRTPDSNLDTILEAIYTETFAKEQLEARRIEFMPATRAAPPAETSSKKSRKRESSPPPPSREAFDAAAFYESLRKQLLEAEKVDESDLAALARARADAIAAALTALGGLDPTRVRVLDPARVKRKKQGSDFVASEMTMKAND